MSLEAIRHKILKLKAQLAADTELRKSQLQKVLRKDAKLLGALGAGKGIKDSFFRFSREKLQKASTKLWMPSK